MSSDFESNPLTKSYGQGLKKEFKDVYDLPDYVDVNTLRDWRARWNSTLTDYYKREKSVSVKGDDTNYIKAVREMRNAASDWIYELAPELRVIGKRQEALIDLEPLIDRATNRIGKWEVIGLTSTIAGSGYLASTGHEGKGLGSLGLVGAIVALRDPNVKARIAFALAKHGKLINASPATLELIGLTRESAIMAEPALKQLALPKRGLLSVPVEQDADQRFLKIPDAGKEEDHIRKAWESFKTAPDYSSEGQFDVITGLPRRKVVQPKSWEGRRLESSGVTHSASAPYAPTSFDDPFHPSYTYRRGDIPKYLVDDAADQRFLSIPNAASEEERIRRAWESYNPAPDYSAEGQYDILTGLRRKVIQPKSWEGRRIGPSGTATPQPPPYIRSPSNDPYDPSFVPGVGERRLPPLTDDPYGTGLIPLKKKKLSR
jgi:hypothetical protein